MSGGLTSFDRSSVTGLYSLAVPLFTVAAWQGRRNAALGLALWTAGASVLAALRSGAFGGFAGALAMGRRVDGRTRLRAQRLLTADLTETTARLAAERDQRAELAVATERTRIARQLHGLVARGVVTMVVQAEAARSLLTSNPTAPRPPSARSSKPDATHSPSCAASSASCARQSPTPDPHRGPQARTAARASRMTVRVLIADDQQLVRAGFAMILSTYGEIEVVAEATNGHEAVKLATSLAPDVVLMDIQMPGLNGIEATRRIIDDGARSTRVLILTTFDLDEYVYDALRAGATGFLLKDTPPEQLVAAVRTAHHGDALLAPSVTRRLIEEFTQPRQPAGDHRATRATQPPRGRGVSSSPAA